MTFIIRTSNVNQQRQRAILAQIERRRRQRQLAERK